MRRSTRTEQTKGYSGPISKVTAATICSGLSVRPNTKIIKATPCLTDAPSAATRISCVSRRAPRSYSSRMRLDWCCIRSRTDHSRSLNTCKPDAKFIDVT